jgi:hypothetical protein
MLWSLLARVGRSVASETVAWAADPKQVPIPSDILVGRGLTRTEDFRTEYEALNRARQLLEDGDLYAVSLCDSSGRVVAGILLQLKLGASSAD